MITDKHQACFTPSVFYPSAILIVLLSALAIIFPDTSSRLYAYLQQHIITYGSWFYILSVALILLFVSYLALSRFGEITLGPDHAQPQYTRITWFSMLFSAGMGIGLMFFGVAEPVMHFLTPPTADPGSLEAMREAMKTTFFHWGLHAWAIYAIVALMLAFFAYRHNLPLTLRSSLYPLIGERIYGPIGHAVDIFAVTGTVFGVATSLGFGAAQVNSGLHYLYDLTLSTQVQIGIIAVITALAAISVATGLDKGIRRLSELNMLLAVGLMLLVLILGPTVFLLEAFVQNTGNYLSGLVQHTFQLYAYDKNDWIGGWTIFYWGWWLAWAPFVGLFIARISRGRTIREFVLGVLLVPSGFTLVWMTIFGNTAIDMIYNQGMTALGEAVGENISAALFVFMEQFPFSGLLSLMGVMMIVVFFVTSADSGALVVDMLCSDGRNDTPVWQRLFWAALMGIVAIALLLAGGLEALQTMTIASALPFTLVLLAGMFGLMRALKVDIYKRESTHQNALSSIPYTAKKDWRERLNSLVHYPQKKAVREFIATDTLAALKEVAKELEIRNYDTRVTQSPDRVVLEVVLEENLEFVYGVYCREHDLPEYTPGADENQYYCRAEVHLREGGQNYDIMGWSVLEVINDVIDQFQKHLHFLHRLS